MGPLDWLVEPNVHYYVTVVSDPDVRRQTTKEKHDKGRSHKHCCDRFAAFFSTILLHWKLFVIRKLLSFHDFQDLYMCNVIFFLLVISIPILYINSIIGFALKVPVSKDFDWYTALHIKLLTRSRQSQFYMLGEKAEGNLPGPLHPN